MFHQQYTFVKYVNHQYILTNSIGCKLISSTLFLEKEILQGMGLTLLLNLTFQYEHI
jgi:hypothetical protein